VLVNSILEVFPEKKQGGGPVRDEQGIPEEYKKISPLPILAEQA
jgi:hypothetical protein